MDRILRLICLRKQSISAHLSELARMQVEGWVRLQAAPYRQKTSYHILLEVSGSWKVPRWTYCRNQHCDGTDNHAHDSIVSCGLVANDY